MMGVKVEEADLNRPLPYDTGYFDLVHSNQVIEHLYDTDTYLSEIRRILKPGGLAVLSTNNLSSWHNIVSLLFGWQPPPMHPSGLRILGNPFDPFHGEAHPTKGDGHLRLFTIRALTEVAALHGLYPRGKVKTVGYYPLTGFPAAVASWLDRRHGVFIVGVFSSEP